MVSQLFNSVEEARRFSRRFKAERKVIEAARKATIMAATLGVWPRWFTETKKAIEALEEVERARLDDNQD